MLSVIHEGVAIALYWEMLQYKSNSNANQGLDNNQK